MWLLLAIVVVAVVGVYIYRLHRSSVFTSNPLSWSSLIDVLLATPKRVTYEVFGPAIARSPYLDPGCPRID